MNEKLLAYGAIIAAIVIMSTIVFPFWNLIPSMVTEKVRVVYIEGNKCTVETSDGYDIRNIPCDSTTKIGDNITASYDVKVKDREHKI